MSTELETTEMVSVSPDKIAHTPGPWLDDVDNINSRTIALYIKINSENDGVAYAFGNTPQERRANARLIAAAPSMLRALKDVSQWCEFNGCGVGHSAEPNWLEDVNAAIKQTEGQ